MRLLVGLSGGVDSSYVVSRARDEDLDVTACLLVMEEGTVPAPDAVDRARETCRALGVPLVVRDVSDAFRASVVEPFLDAYAMGSTPNPCTLCNRDLKLPSLLAVADELGIERVATGHYARIAVGGDAIERVARGADRLKDQSYFLARLSPEQVARLTFPLADETKDEVRSLAGEAGLPAARVRDSEGVCFAPEGDYRELLRAHRPEALRPGAIVDDEGRELGGHQGTALYTLGQRKGLGLCGGPWFVTRLEPCAATVVVSREQPRARRLILGPWHANVPVDGLLNKGADVQTHYRARALPASLGLAGETLEVAFTGEPPLAATGQSAVLYWGDVIVGEGTIASVAWE